MVERIVKVKGPNSGYSLSGHVSELKFGSGVQGAGSMRREICLVFARIRLFELFLRGLEGNFLGPFYGKETKE